MYLFQTDILFKYILYMPQQTYTISRMTQTKNLIFLDLTVKIGKPFIF